MKFKKLGDLIEIKKGKKPHFTETPTSESIRVLQIEDLRGDTNLKYTDNESGVIANESDILLAWDGANAGTIGFGMSGYIGSTIARLRPRKDVKFSTPYLGSFLKSKVDYLRGKTTGATIPHINGSVLRDLKIPIFPFSDQIKIASLLSKTEKLIAQRKESITLLDEYLKSTFLEMFYSNPETVTWEEVWFEELVEQKKSAMRSGPFGSSLLHHEFVEFGDVRVLGIDNVVNNVFQWNKVRCITLEKFNQLSRYQVFPNDVLISIMGTVGRTAIVPAKIPLTINSKHLAAITLDLKKAKPQFIAFALRSHPEILRQLNRNVKGAIMDGLNLTIIKKLKFKNPPITLQNQFAQIIEKTETLKTQYNESLKELESLFGSLSQLAFRGKLNLDKVEAVYELEYESTDNDQEEPRRIDYEKVIAKPKKEKAEKKIESSLWEIARTLSTSRKNIPFNTLEGNAVLKARFSKAPQGFNFQELEAFLIKEGFNYEYDKVRDFVFEKLEAKELIQFYASEDWIKNNRKPLTNSLQQEFSDGQGSIWFVVNNGQE